MKTYSTLLFLLLLPLITWGQCSNDVVPPIAQCSSLTVTLSAVGVAYVTPASIDSLSNDNCGVASYLINNQAIDTLDCSNVGIPSTATLTVIDSSGNTAYCTSTITVVDVTPPSIQCPPTAIDVYLDANGTVLVDPRDIANAWDTCSVLNYYINNLRDTTFDCSDVGTPQIVVIKVEDLSGNIAQCNAVLNVRDTIRPTASCQNITVTLDSTGTATVNGTDINAFSTDNCLISGLLINGQNSVTYTCDSIPVLGDSIVATLTVMDVGGTQNSCQSTITLVDSIGPVISCNDTVIVQLNQQGIAIVQAVSLANNTFDACSPLDFKINGLSADTFNCSTVGTTPLAVLSVSDANGNQSTCFSRIEVLDHVAPTAVCQNVDVYLNTTGVATLSASMIDAGSTDNCLISSQLFSGGMTSKGFTCADVGLNSEVLVVSDIYGNVDSCSAIITVLDTIAPNVICNGIAVNLTYTNQVALTTGAGLNSIATAMDNCGIASILTSPDTLTCQDVGKVVFVVTAVDLSGNIATCQDTAHVFLERPIIVAPTQDTVKFCPMDSLSLSAALPPSGINYASSWIGPNGQLTYNPLLTDTTLNNLLQQSEGDYIFTITPLSGGCSASDSIYLEFDNNCLSSSQISGNVFEDLNFNCSKDIGELNLSNIIVEAKGDSTYYGTTDSLGNYIIILPNNIYTVSPILPSAYWELCGTAQTVNSRNSPVVNWGLQHIVDCPLLEVDIAAPFLRKTNGGSNYVVSYCNNGTRAAFNARVVVEIDPSLDITNSSLPIVNQIGNVCTFFLDTVPVNACGSFSIEVVVSRAAINGQTHCSEAHAYPDSICIPNYWNGAILETGVVCTGDSVLFKIQNIGAAAYQAQDYTIFEDHIIMLIGNTRDIDPGDSIFVGIGADTGHTYRIVVAQETGFPTMLGDSLATSAIEGCKPYDDGLFNIGHITAFSNGNSSPFIAVDCQQNIASLDPNDKLAQPRGYQSAHYIYDHTILDYKIRFQNIGTDTAFLVVLRDTLSPYLDPSTIVMGASSHSYTWRLYDQNILEITYENILLPDSLINEPASHGFVRYRIQQKPNNPAGTIIHNSAGIYFDFNTPIITNRTWHTVGQNFATINVNKILHEKLNVLVYPNPFDYSTTFEVKGEEYQNLQLIVYDLTGRSITEEQAHSTSKIYLSKGDMPTGVYFYQLLGDQKLINTGKIIVR